MELKNNRVCIAGLGYIGLPTAAMLASRGDEVIGFDTNPEVVASINQGKPHFDEPDLQMLLHAAVNTGSLRAGRGPEPADFFIIAVPTPFADSKQPDLSHVNAVCDAIAPHLKPGNTVILESTCPVGTTERICERIGKARPDLAMPSYKDADATSDVFVCHCPERVLPGRMLTELVSNDRIIGGMTEACAKNAASLYDSFVRGELMVTDCRTAEFAKLIENAYRDVNIAFANELSLVSELHRINVWSAIALANRHPRVNILRPGPGVGGHCIAVDPWFLVAGAPDLTRLIQTAREVNEAKPVWVVDRVRAMATKLKNPVVACYGVTFKPDVDDLRASPSLEIVEELATDPELRVIVCDPHIKVLPPTLAGLPNIDLMDADAAREAADLVLFLVGHRCFQSLEQSFFLNKMVVDVVGLMGENQYAAQRQPSKRQPQDDRKLARPTNGRDGNPLEFGPGP